MNRKSSCLFFLLLLASSFNALAGTLSSKDIVTAVGKEETLRNYSQTAGMLLSAMLVKAISVSEPDASSIVERTLGSEDIWAGAANGGSRVNKDFFHQVIQKSPLSYYFKDVSTN